MDFDENILPSPKTMPDQWPTKDKGGNYSMVDGFISPYQLRESQNETNLLKTFLQEQFVRRTLKDSEKHCCSCCKRSLSSMRFTASITNWWRILWNMSDESLLLLNGADYTLYLVFERYAIVFFAMLSFLSLSVFMPIYLSGNSVDLADINATEYVSTIN